MQAREARPETMADREADRNDVLASSFAILTWWIAGGLAALKEPLSFALFGRELRSSAHTSSISIPVAWRTASAFKRQA